MSRVIVVGVLALQGAYIEHIKLLAEAVSQVNAKGITWKIREVRTPSELQECSALIIPGGESTTISLVAERSGLLDPLREFVKAKRKPVWGTCAGLILLAESANRTKKGGQELIGGLDVRVNRNHFGRQTESFEALLDLPFLAPDKTSTPNDTSSKIKPFNGVFIRAPVVEKILLSTQGEQEGEAALDSTVIAPSKSAEQSGFVLPDVEVLAKLPGRSSKAPGALPASLQGEAGDIIVVKQGNAVGTSFHPELTDDPRIHIWWLQQIRDTIESMAKR